MKTINPDKLGLSKDKLMAMENFFKEKYIKNGKLAGIQTLIARKGKVVHFESTGLRDVENNKKIEKDTIFRIYSMTKPITSVALMQLFEQGLFQLADPVGKFLPEFKNPRVFVSGSYPHFMTRPADREISIRDLLTHTAGLTYGFHYRTNIDHAYRKVWSGPRGDNTDFSFPPLDLENFSQSIASLPLEFSPGDKWNYSVATDICGRLIEVLSGMTLDDGVHYNKYMYGNKIRMAAPLSDGLVEYGDGTTATVEQMSKDVTTFLMWAAEPHLEARHQMGFKAIIYLIILTILVYFSMKKIWSRVESEV